MSSKNRDLEALIDIYDAASNVVSFTDDATFDNFKTNLEKQSATLYQIQIIGEATKKLSLEFREAHSHIPWKQMAGMRDIIAHDYNKVDLGTVWDVARNNIPKLLQQIKVLIPEKE